MESIVEKLLESYVLGKDEDQYTILEEIFSKDAEVHFEIHSDTITFPEKIESNRDIAKILSADFNKKYERVKTYYLHGVSPGGATIRRQPWLVVMKEIERDVTRVGTGYYNWDFSEEEGGLKIERLKIYIHEMLEIDDQDSTMLSTLQRGISYPWADIGSALNAVKEYTELGSVGGYLQSQL